LNGSLTQRRSVAFARVELGDLDRIRRPAKASINDVLLAICARSLRGYLRRRNSLPSKPLVGAMPISVHSDDDNSEAVNQVSGALVELATDVDHPQECLQRTMTAAAAAKATHHALGPTMVADLAELAPAPLLRGMARLDQSAGASRRLPPVANVVISNFAGPPIPLYFAGARLQAAYPLGPLAFGAGLNITAQSYLDALHIGINACPDLIDDVTEIATGLTDAINDLLQLTARTQTRAS
jgi:WS/DGAT/MGAT family acyltransferase